jgi:solute carrier family 25 carnitine/acylcarnitine transporter 20/29
MDEFILGYCSGIVQTVVGHPFDTIKTNYQARISIYPLTISKLYRGVIPPIMCNSIVISTQFGLNDYFNKYLWGNHFYSGFIAGIGASIILNPIELYKVRLQNNLKNVYINPLFGLKSTILRESIGGCFYFGGYHYLYDEKKYSSIVAGGAAGWISWLFSYPFDVVKTRVQSDKAKTVIDGLKQKQLWKGFGICSIRSVIVNSVGFYVYQTMKDIE